MYAEKAIDSTSSLERPSSEYEMTFKTLEWLKMVDESCGNDEVLETNKKVRWCLKLYIGSSLFVNIWSFLASTGFWYSYFGPYISVSFCIV